MFDYIYFIPQFTYPFLFSTTCIESEISLLMLLPFFPIEISPEDKWIVIVDRASLLLIQTISGLQKTQELCWRLMELHSLKIVSSGIIWVSLQEVEHLICISVGKENSTVWSI